MAASSSTTVFPNVSGAAHKETHFFGAWPKQQLVAQQTQNKIHDKHQRVNVGGCIVSHQHLRAPARTRFRRKSSLDLIPENPQQEASLESPAATATTPTAVSVTDASIHLDMKSTLLGRMLLFLPNLLLKLAWSIVRYLLFIPLSIAAPSFWLSALLWIFWKLMHFPINLVKWLISSGSDNSLPSSAANAPAVKRTILLSCGSTIQTLHLARNFYSAGTRVVAFELEGIFGLSRFSAAVDKFYVVPRPSAENPDGYIDALCHIVAREKPSVYIPVCATSAAYYDALAKPHLELLGCASFIPGVKDTLLLDDCMALFRKCAELGIDLPPHAEVRSMTQLLNLYARGFMGNFRNILMAAGLQGLLERYKYILPPFRRDFKFGHDISERLPWLLVRDLPGEHYITCTTVKDSRVVANVTCRVHHDTQQLVPLVAPHTRQIPAEQLEIDRWLKLFFAQVRFQRSINAHISFRFVRDQYNGKLLPLGARLGVSIPYICYNRSHAQILCRTVRCAHNNGGLDIDAATSALSAIQRSSITAAALDKRDALFAYWDPLPYCAFYHFQLPLASVKSFLQKRHRSAKSISPRIAMPVH